MAKITLTYPETWLTINISIKDRETWIEEFSWTMTEITNKIYIYDFVEENKDYIYTASCTWYDDMSDAIYYIQSAVENVNEIAEAVKNKLHQQWRSLYYQVTNN